MLSLRYLQHVGSIAQVLRLGCPKAGGVGVPPDPGIKLMSPESAGGFLNADPPGKSSIYDFRLLWPALEVSISGL